MTDDLTDILIGLLCFVMMVLSLIILKMSVESRNRKYGDIGRALAKQHLRQYFYGHQPTGALTTPPPGDE